MSWLGDTPFPLSVLILTCPAASILLLLGEYHFLHSPSSNVNMRVMFIFSSGIFIFNFKEPIWVLGVKKECHSVEHRNLTEMENNKYIQKIIVRLDGRTVFWLNLEQCSCTLCVLILTFPEDSIHASFYWVNLTPFIRHLQALTLNWRLYFCQEF